MEDQKPTLLVVDDTPENIDVLGGVLRAGYKVKIATGGHRALKIAAESPPDLILLDIMMPEIDGYEVLRRLKEHPLTRQIPVIFLTAKSEAEDEALGLSLGAVDYITKPIVPEVVLARVKTQLALSNQNRALEEMVKKRTKELESTRLEIIKRLAQAAEYKDNETGLHVVRMSFYSRLLAVKAGFDERDADLLFHAAPMHDIGKIGIPDNILLKPGKLDADEWDVMRQHPQFGSKILGEHPSELMSLARQIALTHHEKFNGKGYPKGIAGEAIPLEGRIVAIADVFDALTSKRPYKEGWPVEKAMALIAEEAGEHFDPHLAGLFAEILPEVLKVKEQYSEAEG